MADRKMLGEILIEKGIVTATTVERMLVQASSSNQRLGWFLADRGLITGEELAAALAEQFGIKYLQNIAQYSYPKGLFELISPEVAIQFHLFPLRQEGDKLLVAVTDPTDMNMVKNITRNNGLNLVPAVVSRNDFFAAYCKHYLGVTANQNQEDTILVADDDRMTLEMIKGLLERSGFKVLLAANGMEAYKTIVANRPALVLTDKEMPALDGFGLLKLVKAINEFRFIPILLVSDKTTDEEEERLFEMGFFDFIPKPIKGASLISRVRRALGTAPPGATRSWAVL